MLIQEGHAGYIIGKSGARIKELRMVIIDVFLHAPFLCITHSQRCCTVKVNTEQM